MGVARRVFAEALGREIVQRGNVLLGGCRTGLDATVAKAAAAAARDSKIDPRKCIKSWVTKSTKPAHSEGEIIRSQMTDWQTVPRGLVYPEPFQEADVTVIVGGWDGTHYAASWARLANKPIVPVATFGLAAAEIFRDELNSFDRRYSSKISLNEYQCLDRLLPDWDEKTIKAFATEVVCLAQRLVKPSEAFVVMSFAERGELKDVFKTFYRVCKNAGYEAFKVNDHVDPNQRLIPAIINSIRKSAFVIVDVTDPRPNVYYELGYAHALGKDVILTAKEGTKREFDVADVPTIMWDCQDTLETRLWEQLTRMGLCLSTANAASP